METGDLHGPFLPYDVLGRIARQACPDSLALWGFKLEIARADKRDPAYRGMSASACGPSARPRFPLVIASARPGPASWRVVTGAIAAKSAPLTARRDGL